MVAKFKKGDAVVIKGNESPVMTITKVIESTSEQPLDRTFYECHCKECGTTKYRESEIELFDSALTI